MKSKVPIEETKFCHCLAARKRARDLTRRYEAALRPFGLKATQFSILSVLAIKGQTLLTQLARILGLERTTLTRSLGILEANGWVYSRSSEDGRERPIEITGEGLKLLEEAFPHWKKVQDSVSQS